MSAARAQHRIAIASVTSTFFILCALPTLAQQRTWSSSDDFAEGIFDNLHSNDADQLSLDSTSREHAFLWVAKSGRHTIVRIDADTGEVLGEYRTAPSLAAGDPSRTVVDHQGNVWVGNMGEGSGGRGSVVQIGLVVGGTRVHKNADGSITPDAAGEYLAPPFDYSTAIDRDGDGLIHTSRGLDHVLSWPSGSDADGGSPAFVEDANDECIRVFQRTSAPYVHHIALDADGFVWVGGYGSESTGFDRLDSHNGEVLESLMPDCGGYGGMIDDNGAMWSSSLNQGAVLRYDPQTGTQSCLPVPSPYGMALDPSGHVWATTWTSNSVVKFAADGSVVDGFPKPAGGGRSSGIAIGADGDVWIANHSSGRVARLDADGNVRTTIATGSGPMGVDVDARGRVWVTHLNHHNVVRIDPSAGGNALGAVDLAIPLGYRAAPAGMGNMSGLLEILTYAPQGTWTVQFDGGRDAVRWSRLQWQSNEPEATGVGVHVRSADERSALAEVPWFPASNDIDLDNVVGRYIEIRVTLSADAAAGASPHVDGITVNSHEDLEPVELAAEASVEQLWPPNKRMVPVQIAITDPDGRLVDYRITRITQDEPVASSDDDWERVQFDAVGIGETVAYLRAERLGDGNGRVYAIHYETVDELVRGQQGFVTVCVPHDRGRKCNCIDDGQEFDATGGLATALKSDIPMRQYPNPFNPNTTIEYELRQPGAVVLSVFDVRGRRVRDLVRQDQLPGLHRAGWDGRNEQGLMVPSGVYLYQLRSNDAVVTDRMLMTK